MTTLLRMQEQADDAAAGTQFFLNADDAYELHTPEQVRTITEAIIGQLEPRSGGAAMTLSANFRRFVQEMEARSAELSLPTRPPRDLVMANVLQGGPASTQSSSVVALQQQSMGEIASIRPGATLPLTLPPPVSSVKARSNTKRLSPSGNFEHGVRYRDAAKKNEPPSVNATAAGAPAYIHPTGGIAAGTHSTPASNRSAAPTITVASAMEEDDDANVSLATPGPVSDEEPALLDTLR